MSEATEEVRQEFLKQLDEASAKKEAHHQRELDCTDEIWDVLIKHFGHPDDEKSSIIHCPEVFARIFGSLMYKDGSDSGIAQLFAWTIDAYVQRQVLKLLPVFKETYRMLIERGHTENNKYEFNDLDNHAWYIPHESLQIMVTTDQNTNFIFRRNYDKPPEGADPRLFSFLKNDFLCFRYWDKWDSTDEYEMVEHGDIRVHGKPLAIRLAKRYVERYADDYPENRNPYRYSLPWFEKKFEDLEYEDSRNGSFVFGWRHEERPKSSHTHALLGIIGAAINDLLWTHQAMLRDLEPVSETTKRVKDIRVGMGLDEKKETRYTRHIGTLCRVCGTMTTPTYVGNRQTGHHCSKCGEDFET